MKKLKTETLTKTICQLPFPFGNQHGCPVLGYPYADRNISQSATAYSSGRYRPFKETVLCG